MKQAMRIVGLILLFTILVSCEPTAPTAVVVAPGATEASGSAATAAPGAAASPPAASPEATATPDTALAAIRPPYPGQYCWNSSGGIQGPAAPPAPFLYQPFEGELTVGNWTSQMDHDRPVYVPNGEVDALGERLRFDMAPGPGLAGGLEGSSKSGSRAFPAGTSYADVVGQGFSILAYQSPSSEDYTYYDGHDGHDFAFKGQALAAADGQVAFVGDYGNTLGRVVEIYHPQGYLTRYAHLAAFAEGLAVGNQVTAGQPIGTIGGSAVVDGQMTDGYWDAHLHFSVFRWNGERKAWQVTDPFGWDPWAGPDEAAREAKQREDPLVACNGEVSYDLWVDQWPRSVNDTTAKTAFYPTGDKYVGGWLGETSEPAPPTATPPAVPTNTPAPTEASSSLAGVWEQVPEQADYTWGLLFTRVEFLDAGIFILNFANAAGRYSFPDAAHIKLESPGSALMYGYSLSGGILALTDANGSEWRFRRIAGEPANPPSPPVQAADLVGGWAQVPEQADYTWGLLFTYMQFLDDGSFVLNIMNAAGEYYLADATHLAFENPASMMVYSFSLSDNVLTLIDLDGGEWRFQPDAVSSPIPPVQTADIVGTWEKSAYQADWGLLFTRIQFFADGAFVINLADTTGQYSFPDDSHIKLESSGGALLYTFILSGDSLTLVDANGGGWTFSRVP